MNKETQKTILVTGGSGFIGSITCKLLVDSGFNVINIDRVKSSLDGVTQYPFDIDNHQLKGVIELTKPDAVIHLAADHSVPLSIKDPASTYANNVANNINNIDELYTSTLPDISNPLATVYLRYSVGYVGAFLISKNGSKLAPVPVEPIIIGQ